MARTTRNLALGAALFAALVAAVSAAAPLTVTCSPTSYLYVSGFNRRALARSGRRGAHGGGA
jgi:hypothetical protein